MVAGDHESEVVSPAAGHGDVEASSRCCWGDERDAGVGGVALVAVVGCGVAEVDVVTGIVDGQGDEGVVSVPAHEEVTVGGGVGGRY